MNKIKIIECPRDAMQGLTHQVPTEVKITYIQKLLACGFDTLDFGSFVSPKAIPQMADTQQVYEALLPLTSKTKLLAIVANQRGVEQALKNPSIHYLGYPLSISEEFQQRNTNKSIEEAIGEIKGLLPLVQTHEKELVVYLSMAFGNPYGEDNGRDKITSIINDLKAKGVKIFSLSDTIGCGQPDLIFKTLEDVIKKHHEIEIGAHLHAVPGTEKPLVEAVIDAGCVRIDGALGGYGGCPFATDKLTGNLATEIIIQVLEERGIAHGVNQALLQEGVRLHSRVF